MRAFLETLESKPYYQLIQHKYEGKIARRSGVSYMNHIQEGAFIIHHLYGADEELLEAYCLHPIFQNDQLLSQLFCNVHDGLSLISPRAILLGMEYRRVANSYTIKSKVRNPESIDIGPLEKVHQMLVADKIQNKKDFMKYIYRKHNRPSYKKASEHGLRYFDSWLDRLQISQETYNAIIARIEQGAPN